ncbi:MULTISPECIES: hypothetical protein [Myxococcus]|nr:MULTISPECIES: hypothetical protein [Myxococcus]NOJ54749.1 hypothetical protein [Myxococcus xanthus]QPM83599.1 hypothetical protein I5Q59_26465 [Myxococcus xanthus]QVW72115.1 hypothetical protein JTM82_31815 [Myxococcus xanthus DZ2]UEO08820.1 hypothetical protein K1515_10980 [Myxococcus xanthus DZ2]UYI12702.1 hypothetical protein N3T43_27045 [Myxococcus xanthus]
MTRTARCSRAMMLTGVMVGLCLGVQGAALTLVPGKGVPEDCCGAAGRPVKFILDE